MSGKKFWINKVVFCSLIIITLGTAAWNRKSLIFDNELFVAVTFMESEFASGIFSKENITLRPSFSKAVIVGTFFSEKNNYKSSF